MRASTISAIVLAFVLGAVGLTLGIYEFINRGGGSKLWFYWTAPLLAISFFAVMIQLAVMYWVKVGRLETKGRPRK